MIILYLNSLVYIHAFMHLCINVLYLCRKLETKTSSPPFDMKAVWVTFFPAFTWQIMNVVVNLFRKTIPIHADMNCVATNSFPVHFFTSITLSCATNNWIKYFPYYHSKQICHIITYITKIIMGWYVALLIEFVFQKLYHWNRTEHCCIIFTVIICLETHF